MGNKRQIIMLVDDNMANLIAGKAMLKDLYDVFPIPSGEKFFELLNKITPDLILLDIEMPEMNGYEVIKKLKENYETAEIPVIFLTAYSDPGSELEGLNLGAVDYISKPFSTPLLLKRIKNHLLMSVQRKELRDYNGNLQQKVQEKTKEVMDLQNAILNTMAEMVEFRDDITGGHIGRTQAYLKLLIDALRERKIYWEEVSNWKLDSLIPSAQLHDVGKILISDTILNKSGKLDADEFVIIKMHPIFGEQAIDSIMKNSAEYDFLVYAKIFAGTHHEKWDGTGYPRGLRGADIPLQGRLMAIADVYDALIAERPYKKALSTWEAEKIIVAGKGSHFDPVLVDLFQTLAQEFAEIVKRSVSSQGAETAAG